MSHGFDANAIALHGTEDEQNNSPVAIDGPKDEELVYLSLSRQDLKNRRLLRPRQNLSFQLRVERVLLQAHR